MPSNFLPKRGLFTEFYKYNTENPAAPQVIVADISHQVKVHNNV